jgi:DNA-binding transcriptional ArsR family regulator
LIGSADTKLSLLADDRDTAVESAMVAAANMVEVAALVGDTARATILNALMSGQALTGSELAFLARISRPTASEHLTKLVNARLITVAKKRRFSYYRIASPLVARMLESIKAVAAIELPARLLPGISEPRRVRVHCRRSCQASSNRGGFGNLTGVRAAPLRGRDSPHRRRLPARHLPRNVAGTVACRAAGMRRLRFSQLRCRLAGIMFGHDHPDPRHR